MTDEFDIEAEKAQLRAKLDDLRPERYKSGQVEWAESVVKRLAELAELTPARRKQATRQWAEGQVKQWDESATRSANAFFRRLKIDGQLPLDFKTHGHLPVAIDHEKFRLGTLTAELGEQWELHERRRSAQDFKARTDACDGMASLVRWIRLCGGTFDDLDPDVCITDDEDGDE